MSVQNLSEKEGLAGWVIFVRTGLGVVLVACVITLAGLGYRLWQVQRQLSIRVRVLESQAVSTEKAIRELRGRMATEPPADSAWMPPADSEHPGENETREPARSPE